MSGKPSKNGRDGRGRFLPGHGFSKGKGNPHCGKVHLWRTAFARAVSPADIEHVVKNLVKSARAGERWAVELLLDRVLGKPASFEALELLERIEQLEKTYAEPARTCTTT